MTPLRSSRRTNPITYFLAFILLIGFLYFIFAGPDGPSVSAIRQRGETASNILSPPSLPFLRPKNPEAPRGPPPVVHYHLNEMTTTSEPIKHRESVLILTPLSKYYPAYWQNLLKLEYPRELISVGFIIPKDVAGNLATKQLQEDIAKTQATKQGFASITILRQDFEVPITSQQESERHKLASQKARRSAMAKARNSLLFTTMGPTTSWVLWMDADIVETPPTLIQDLASHNKSIIAPNCFQRFWNAETGKMDVRPYDFNSWIDSDIAQELAAKMGKDELLLEGYPEIVTYRSLMAHMPEQEGVAGDLHREVPLDGVGGTTLLVKSDVHRDGAMFPPFVFYHLIETEGFAKMASRLGWKAWGLPNYYVYHYNE